MANIFEWGRQKTQTSPSTTQQASGAQPQAQAQSNPYAGQTWQQIYSDYTSKNPANTQSLYGLNDAFQSAGINSAKVPHGDAYSGDKLYIGGSMYDLGSGLDNPNGGGSWWQNPSPYTNDYGPGTGYGQNEWTNFVNEKGYTAADARQNLPEWVKEFNASHPNAGWEATGRPGDYDTINVPGIGIVDVATAGNQWWWGPEGPQQGAGGGAGGGGFDPSSFFNGSMAGLSGLTYSPWTPDPRNQSLWSQLMGRSTQSLIPTADNPVIKAQTDAFRAEQERGSRNYLNDLAEKGGPYANNSTEARMAHEQAAQNTASMQGQLLQNEVNARRTEISQALQEMGSLLSDDQRLALQKELAYLSNDQAMRSLGLQAEDRASYWDAIRSGLIG